MSTEGISELQEGYVILQRISENVNAFKHILPSFFPEIQIIDNQIIGLEGLIREKFNALFEEASEFKKYV